MKAHLILYIVELKQEKNTIIFKKKIIQVSKIIEYKFIFFFIISFLLSLFFWYYLGCFCAVYKNTQLHLLKDSAISFAFSLFYPFGYYLIPGIFRIPSLHKKTRKHLYNFSKLLQTIL